MKELKEIVKSIIKDEGFTKKEVIVYGVIAPAVLVLACVLASLIDKA